MSTDGEPAGLDHNSQFQPLNRVSDILCGEIFHPIQSQSQPLNRVSDILWIFSHNNDFDEKTNLSFSSNLI